MPANVKVLLVDDNPMVLEMLRQGLAQLATVHTAADGGDAMLKAIDDLPDLIVTDYDMPGMNGRQLLEKIKARAATAKVPIILLASRADISEKLKMVQDNVRWTVTATDEEFLLRVTIDLTGQIPKSVTVK